MLLVIWKPNHELNNVMRRLLRYDSAVDDIQHGGEAFCLKNGGFLDT